MIHVVNLLVRFTIGVGRSQHILCKYVFNYYVMRCLVTKMLLSSRKAADILQEFKSHQQYLRPISSLRVLKDTYFERNLFQLPSPCSCWSMCIPWITNMFQWPRLTQRILVVHSSLGWCGLLSCWNRILRLGFDQK